MRACRGDAFPRYHPGSPPETGLSASDCYRTVPVTRDEYVEAYLVPAIPAFPVQFEAQERYSEEAVASALTMVPAVAGTDQTRFAGPVLLLVSVEACFI